MSGGSNAVNEEGYGEGVYDWSDLIGNSGDDRAYAVTQDAIGNVYVGVQTTSSLQGSNAGSYDAALVKYNSVGVKQWTRQTGSSAADYVKAVATDSEGNAYIIGDVSNAAYDGQSAWETVMYLSRSIRVMGPNSGQSNLEQHKTIKQLMPLLITTPSTS